MRFRGKKLPLAIMILLSACATRLRFEAPVDPLAVLAQGALLYARLEGGALREFAPALLPGRSAQALAPLLERSVSLGLAVRAEAATAPRRGAYPAFEAVFLGDYPWRSASLALGADRAWKRRGSAFENAEEGLYAALPGPEAVLASSVPLEPLLDRLLAPGSHPLPPRLASRAGSSGLLAYLPEPFARLGELLVGERFELPVTGLLITGSRSGEEGYALEIVFAMGDERSARVYRPAARLAWYAFARAAFPGAGTALLLPEFVLEGELVTARASIAREELAAGLARLAAAASPAAPAPADATAP